MIVSLTRQKQHEMMRGKEKTKAEEKPVGSEIQVQTDFSIRQFVVS